MFEEYHIYFRSAGEMKRVEGNVIWLDPANSVGLSAQVPWIFNATLRKNIIMDAPFDDLRFEHSTSNYLIEVTIKELIEEQKTSVYKLMLLWYF